MEERRRRGVRELMTTPHDDDHQLTKVLTSPRCRQVPSVWMTSSARSECSESHTRPMVMISGLLRRTRAIRSCWPHWLCGEGGGVQTEEPQS